MFRRKTVSLIKLAAAMTTSLRSVGNTPPRNIRTLLIRYYACKLTTSGGKFSKLFSERQLATTVGSSTPTIDIPSAG